MSVENKKFLNSTGVGSLWTKIRNRYDSKLDSVVNSDDSITVTNDRELAVHISEDPTNVLQVKSSGNKGLYVPAPAAADTYSVVQANSNDYAAVYNLMRYAGGTGAGVQCGVSINIPKDMVVSSGTVETKEESGVWGPVGTYIHLVLANATNDDIYIPVNGLIEYVTSGSQPGDMVVVSIDNNHQVTVSITDGSITKAKLAQGVQDSLDAADSAVQSVVEGDSNGEIKVDGVAVAVHGLGSAAYTNSSAYDVSGAAAAVLGTSADGSGANTVYGARAYADDIYAAIQALTEQEILAAIAAANTTIDSEPEEEEPTGE